MIWQYICDSLLNAWDVLMEAGTWLLGGFLLAGVVYVLMPTDKVTSHLGKPGLGGVIKASLVGIPLPLCSCSVIPVASSLRKQGASRGAVAGFLISTPETGVDSIALSYALLGPVLAIARPISALATALIAGCFINRISEQPSDPGQIAAAQESCCCRESSCSGADTPRSPGGSKVALAIRFGLVDMFVDLSHWLLMGFVLAGMVATLIPPGYLEQYVGEGLFSKLLMVAIGLPMYICATSSTPVAAMLIAKGLSPGAALVFMLVGPATNIATMVVVGRDLGRSGLLLYLASIILVSIASGMVLDSLVDLPYTGNFSLEHSHSSVSFLKLPSAIVLLLLMVNGLRIKYGKGAVRSESPSA